MKNRPLFFLLVIWLCGSSLIAQGIHQLTACILQSPASESTPTSTSSSSQITAREYCAFLNAVATSDPHYLYDAKISTNLEGGCILRSGSVGSYSYSVVQGKESSPIPFLSWVDAMRYCNWLENASITSSEDIDVTEYGSYELQGDQLISINPNAIYLVENDPAYDPELGSNSFEFQIINTTAASSLAKTSSGSNGKDTSWEEKVVGVAAGVGIILGGGGEEHVAEVTSGDSTIGPVEAKLASQMDIARQTPQLKTPLGQNSSPLMMFGGDEETQAKAPSDPRAVINRGDARNRATSGDSSQTSRDTTLAVAEKPTTRGSLNDEVESISSTSNFLLRANRDEFHYPLSTHFTTTKRIMVPRGASWSSALQGVTATFGMMVGQYFNHDNAYHSLLELQRENIKQPKHLFSLQSSFIARKAFDEKIHRQIRLALNSSQTSWKTPVLLSSESRIQKTSPSESLVARHIFLATPTESKNYFSWNQLAAGIGEAFGMNRFVSYCEKGYKGGEKKDVLFPVPNFPVPNKGDDRSGWNVSNLIQIGPSQLNIKIGTRTISVSYDPNTANDTSLSDRKEDKKTQPTEKTVEESQKKAEGAAIRLFSNWQNKFTKDGEKKLFESIVNKTNHEFQIATKAKDEATLKLKMAEESMKETEKKFEASAVEYSKFRQVAYDECHKYISYWEHVASTVVVSDELSKLHHDSYLRKIEQAKAQCTQQEEKLRNDEHANDPSLLFSTIYNELDKTKKKAIQASMIADGKKPYWAHDKYTYQEYSNSSRIAAKEWENLIVMMQYLKIHHQDDGTLEDKITKAENQKSYYSSIVKIADDNAANAN